LIVRSVIARRSEPVVDRALAVDSVLVVETGVSVAVSVGVAGRVVGSAV
jgi:hypothetical protein